MAVVGASRSRDSIGYALVHNLLVNGFEGALFPVNPRATAIHSIKVYPSLSAIPDPVDLAVIAVPRDAVAAVVDEAIEHGISGLVVITAGFAETGPEGAALEKELCEKVRAAKVRMIGPNCMGVINTSEGVCLNATFAPTPAVAGSIGFVSQSGALGVAVLNAASDLGIGLTQFVSMGNKADVSGNDLLEYWEEDERTRVIAMYLESFGNPRHFTEIAKRVARKKPILVVKSGRTTEGARAASSHTGALAGADVTVSAFLDQCGVLRADTIEELFDVARALDRCPLPDGPRVAILTNAGGPAIMATDACVNSGLAIAQLSSETRDRLAAFLPPEASFANPVDMIASADAGSYARALEILLEDAGVDAVIVVNVTPLLANPIDVLEAVSEATSEHALGARLIKSGDTAAGGAQHRVAGGDVPLHRAPEPRVEVGGALGDEAQLQGRPRRDQLLDRQRREVLVRALVAMRAARHHDEAVVRGRAAPDRDRFALATRTPRLAAGDLGAGPVGHAARRHVDGPDRGCAVLDQRDVDGELSVAADELARAIEGIDEPERDALDVRHDARGDLLLGDDRELGRELCQSSEDDLLSGVVGGRHRRGVVLRLDLEVGLVDLQHRRARLDRDLPDRGGELAVVEVHRGHLPSALRCLACCIVGARRAAVQPRRYR